MRLVTMAIELYDWKALLALVDERFCQWEREYDQGADERFLRDLWRLLKQSGAPLEEVT
jgi:hypothetical protein